MPQIALESLAAQFGCESLEQAATAFTCGNFVSVVKSDDFKALDFEKVKQLVSHQGHPTVRFGKYLFVRPKIV